MNVSSASTASTALTGSAPGQQARQDFKNLAQALKSGDIDAAKTAYAAQAKNAPAGAANDANNPLAQIGKALESGDLGAAQKAMTAAQTHRGHRGGRHEGTEQEARPNASSTPAASPPTDTSGTLLNVVA